MTNLTIVNQNGKLLVESRQVAQMVDRQHNELMKSIRQYCEYLREGNFAQSDFFIESTYINSQNKEQPCFLITKKGCDMVANKMTGEKGVLFTATYVTRFEEMEKQLQSPIKLTPAPRPRTRMVSTAIKDVDATAKQIMKLYGVKEGIATATALQMIERIYQMDMSPIKKLLPATTEEIGRLTATEIAKRMNIAFKTGNPDAATVNRMLKGAGLMTATGNKKQAYELTLAGKQYGEVVPYTNNGHSGYEIRWNQSVIELLKENQTA